MKLAITLLSYGLLTLSAPAFSQDAAPTEPPAANSQASTSPVLAPGAAEVPDESKGKLDAPAASAQTVAVSQVRIVRLSQVTGKVELDRQTGGPKFDAAFMNLPIVAGAALRTKEGVAEVEFEDNSSLRLTPESQLEFPKLGRSASGATVTAVNLVRGSLYISLAASKTSGEFTLNAAGRVVSVSPSTHLRFDLDASNARMVVFQGTATVSDLAGPVVVTKKKAISFDIASSAPPQFTKVGEAELYDAWDKNSADYHKVRANALVAGLTSSPYSYGLNDLSYYGSFSDVGGCGSMWRPYLANAAFDPYSSGVWSWYPGQGYSWVSLYPWGWAPFHFGSWNYCPAGGGWGWQPQGSWRGLQNHPSTLQLRGPGHGPVHGPVRPVPPAPPSRGQPTLIGVNLKSLQTSQPGSDGKFVFRGGSAGLGVPRGVFNNLSKISQHAEIHGTTSTTLSERQIGVGMMAPGRSAMIASSYSASSANHASAAHAGSNSTGASGSFASNHSISPASSSSASAGSSMHSGSFSSAAPASGAAPAPAGAASHH